MPPSVSSDSAPASRWRWLVDENVAPRVAEFLRAREHDVVDVKERRLFGLPADELFAMAQKEKRVVLTYDVDFFVGSNEYHTKPEQLSAYFFAFAYASRNKNLG